MPRLRVHNLSMSLDGYVAGPCQCLDHPLGVGGESLHDWMFAARSAPEAPGTDGGEAGRVDDRFVAAGTTGIGATIMGRNMFGPIRGPWNGEEDWTGWWGDDPPFHHPVFVLTHHPRPTIEMKGGTTFHFVDGGIEAALEPAFDAAHGADVRIGGGAATVQQYLRARLVDEMHIAVVPILLGGGERLFENLGDDLPGYECIELVSTPVVAHVRLVRTAAKATTA